MIPKAATRPRTHTNAGVPNWRSQSHVRKTKRGSAPDGSYVDEPLMLVAGGSKYYIHSNHLFSPAALTDSTGAVVDALGRRVAKEASELNTVFVNAGAQTISEYDDGAATTAPTRQYVYGSYVDEPVMMVSGAGTKSYFHQNHLYSVAAMTNSTGTVVERYRYDAYGKRTVTNAAGTPIAASTVGNQVGFTGRYHDVETGLLYYRNRMANPSTGRYLSRNTISLYDNLKYTFSVKMTPVQWNVRDIGLGYFRDRAELSIATRMGKVPGLEYIDGLCSYAWPLGLDPSGEPGDLFEGFDNLFDNAKNLFDQAQAAGEIPDDIDGCKTALAQYKAEPNHENCLEACTACTLPFAGVNPLGATVALGQCKCACDEKHK